MSLLKSVATFGGYTLISRFTGFARDMVIANYLGAGLVSDAFFVSFKLPNLFRSLFAEGAFTAAFVPMLSGKIVSDGKEKAILFASQAISVLTFFLAIFVLVMEFAMPWVVELLAPGFSNDAGKLALATTLSRITFPFLLFISIVSFQSGILNSFNKFAAPASTPIILNLTMIASAFIFKNIGPTPAHGIALGITIAGILEVLWLKYFLQREHVTIKPQINIVQILKLDDIKTLFRRIAPGILGAGIYQINMVIDMVLVSLVGTGAISWLYYANRLQQLPLGVVGAAISVALLPILSKALKANNHKEAISTQNKAIEYGALLSIPSAVALIILAHPIINILFERGQFTAQDTHMTALAVIAYSLGLPAYVFVKALTPNFFARGNTKTPVKYSLIVFIANLILCLTLMQKFGHIGISTATSCAAYVSLYQYIHGLKKRNYWTFDKLLITKICKIILCSVIMGLCLYIAQQALTLFHINWLTYNLTYKIIIFGFLCTLGVASFLLIAKLTNTINISEIIKTLLKKGK